MLFASASLLPPSLSAVSAKEVSDWGEGFVVDMIGLSVFVSPTRKRGPALIQSSARLVMSRCPSLALRANNYTPRFTAPCGVRRRAVRLGTSGPEAPYDCSSPNYAP